MYIFERDFFLSLYLESKEKIFLSGKDDVSESTVNLIKNSLNEKLPLAGSWNANTFDQDWQINSLISSGHVIMPWFIFYEGNESWDSIKGRNEKPLEFVSRNKLPISFKQNQFEMRMIDRGWCSRPEGQNPCYQKLDGTFVTNQLGVLEPTELWYQIGYEMGSQPWLKKFQEIYPDPPLVILLDNHEPSLNDDLLNSKQYIDKYGNDSRYKDQDFMDQIKKNAWKEKYEARFRGFRDALISENWKRNLKDVPYKGYFRHASEVIQKSEQGWGGISASSYTLRYMGDRDYLVMGPQVEAGNLRLGCEETKRNLNPNFHCEILTSYGDFSAVQGLEIEKQTFTPERYRGTTQFVLWESKPDTFREWRSWSTPRNGIYGLFFNILLNSVDRIYYIPVLNRFYKEGKLVPNKKSSCLTEQQYSDKDNFFILDSDANQGLSWGNCGSVVNVYSLALVIGESPNRQWLLYTHAPLGTRENVSIIIPDYKEIRVPKSEEGGSFYLIDESQNSIIPIDSLNFPHNHQPVANNDEYLVPEGETLNVTNRWATGAYKPLWFNDIDIDGDPLKFILVEAPSNGVLSLNQDGTFVYTPNPGFNGIDSFRYKVNDGSLDSNIATVKISIESLNIIIDDGDPGYSEFDLWGNGSVQGSYVGYGEDYRFHVSSDSNGLEPISRATWTVRDLPPGQYDVYTTWAPSWSRTTAAPYSIFDNDKKLDTIRINQQIAPVGITEGNTPWQKLGTYEIKSGIFKLQVTSEGPWVVTGRTLVIADALRLENKNSGEVWYVDNKDPGFETTANWVPEKSSNSYNGDRRIQTALDPRSGHVLSKAIWEFNNLSYGVYDVFISWSGSSLNNLGSVNYYLYRGGESFYRSISQKESPSSLSYKNASWYKWGSFLIEDGKLKVEVNNGGKSGRIIADAVGLIGPKQFRGQIIDNGDLGYEEYGGSWFENSGGYKGDARRANIGGGGRYKFKVPNGYYKIYLTWIPTGWAVTNLPIKIYDGENLKYTVEIDQSKYPDDLEFDSVMWEDIGDYKIESGNLTIEIFNNFSNSKVFLDAVWVSSLEDLSCSDNDKDGFGAYPNSGNVAGCKYNEEDCDDSNNLINPKIKEGWNPKEKWSYCNDNIDNNCDGKIDCEDRGCINSPNCINIQTPILPECFKNKEYCNDNNECTLDYCTLSGCKYVFSSNNECLELIKDCRDSDRDGVLDYDPIKCSIGKDKCLEDIRQVSLDRLAPKISNGDVKFNGDIKNVSNLTIEKFNIGKIKFKENLNLLITNDSGCFDNIKLDNLVEIKEKKIEIKTSDFNEFNKKAILEFYNIDYVEPKVLKDGSICSECSILSYDKNSGVLTIEVPGFSSYEIIEGAEVFCGNSICDRNEDCASCPNDCGSCSSQGGSSTQQGSGVFVFRRTNCTPNLSCSYGECENGYRNLFCKDLNSCVEDFISYENRTTCYNAPLINTLINESIKDKKSFKIIYNFFLIILASLIISILIWIILLHFRKNK